ncbi:hypothetical protein M1563_03920 [Patescibacteria group bacterium]|nr:hypothetical protein [Patescibacteria group bacterium]
MPESYSERVLRHVKEGQIDPSTLLRGVKQLPGYFRELDSTRYSIQGTSHKDYQDISGLEFFTYQVSSAKPSTIPGRSYLSKIYIVSLPSGCSFDVQIAPDSEHLVRTHEYINFDSQAIATFTGPTFERDEHFPNNGFYHQELGQVIEFQETNPPRQRRGALAVTETGQLILMDDQQKWQLVNRKYPEIRAMSGTAGYITSQDEQLDPKIDERYGNTDASFLIRFSTQSAERYALLIPSIMTPIRVIRTSIEDMITVDHGSGNYFAVELEMTGASVVLRKQPPQAVNATKVIGGDGYSFRRDHYLVYPPQIEK